MHKFKMNHARVGAVIMAAAMTFSMVPAVATSAATTNNTKTVAKTAKSISLKSKKTVTVTKGKSVTLKAQVKPKKATKVTWKITSGKKVVKLVTKKNANKKGIAQSKVKGLKKGTATITASIKTSAGKTKKVTFTVKVKAASSSQDTTRTIIGSFNGGGDEDYIYYPAYYINSGVIDTTSLAGVAAGTASGDVSGSAASNLKIDDSQSGDNGIIIKDTNYSITNADINMQTDADGLDTSDFTGRGSAVMALGDSDVTLSDSTITTAGVATMPLFVDDGATLTMSNSTIESKGGTLHSAYLNSPDQQTMVAPPWILGIMGTARGANVMGTDSTLNCLDSDTSAGAWAVLSTDAGTNMTLNMYNSSLTTNNANESEAAALQEAGGQLETNDNPYTVNYGSGYGTYAIGDAQETFAGTEVNVGTYAVIFTGGSATFTSTTQGFTYAMTQADGSTQNYNSQETNVAEVNSDTFGFMFHQSENTLTIEKGTKINSGYATFLVKTGGMSVEDATVSVDKAVINNGGVLIQVMDNDDTTTGLDMSTFSFYEKHTEDAGFYTGTGETADTSASQDFTFTNGDYTGNIYNASGSDQNTQLTPSVLNVTLGKGATLTGAAAATSAIHVTYAGSQYVKNTLGGDAVESTDDATILGYQNTSFTMSEYWSIGQVANAIHYNGGNDINMTLTNDAVWTVDGTSNIKSLKISDSASVVVKDGVTLTVNGTEYGAGTYTASNFAAN